MRYESNYYYSKSNENYKLLGIDVAQQTLKIVDRAFRSFLNLVKSKTQDRYDRKIKLPNYLEKEGYFLLVIPTRQGKLPVKNGKFAIPMFPVFKKQYVKIELNFPKRLTKKNIKEVRIHPK